MNEEIKRKYSCHYCNKTYSRKVWYDRHACVAGAKFEEMATDIIQKAYKFWLYWMKRQKMIKEDVPFSRFQKSKLMADFVALSQFINQKNFVSEYSYIDWLIENRIPCDKWCNDDPKFRDKFEIYMCNHENPTYHAEIFINEVRKWLMVDESRTINDFFSQLSPGSILNMARQRKIKPWVLFTYDPVYSKWGNSEYVFSKIKDIIDCPYWADKIKNDPESVKKTRDILNKTFE